VSAHALLPKAPEAFALEASSRRQKTKSDTDSRLTPVLLMPGAHVMLQTLCATPDS
jgi:hypothetical protein